MSREAMRRALDALEVLDRVMQRSERTNSAINALRAALAEPEQEPVALSDERIDFIADTVVKGMPEGISGFCKSWGWRQFARAILQDCAGHYAPTPQPDTDCHLQGICQRSGYSITTPRKPDLEALNTELVEALREIEPILARMYGAQYRLYLQPMQIVRGALAKWEAASK